MLYIVPYIYVCMNILLQKSKTAARLASKKRNVDSSGAAISVIDEVHKLKDVKVTITYYTYLLIFCGQIKGYNSSITTIICQGGMYVRSYRTIVGTKQMSIFSLPKFTTTFEGSLNFSYNATLLTLVIIGINNEWTYSTNTK